MVHDHDPLSSFDDTDSEHPALVTFIGGSEALRVSDLTEPQLVTELVTHLASLLGPWVTQYTDITVKNWADEEWIGGEWEMYNDKVSKLMASSRVFFSLRTSVFILGAPSVTLQPGTLDSWPTLRFPHDRSHKYKLDECNVLWTPQ